MDSQTLQSIQKAEKIISGHKEVFGLKEGQEDKYIPEFDWVNPRVWEYVIE